MKKLLLFSFLFTMLSATMAQSVGEAAPEINLPDVNNQKVSLQSLKGKVVLLDFWASWCGPCIAANKQFTKTYKKLKEKGFEIYSVSVDANAEAWKKAIKKQKITWLQVIDPGNWNSATAKAWGIEALPTTFLIDKKGIVRAVDLEGKELTKAINDLLAE